MTFGPFTSLWVFDNQDLAKWLSDAQIAIETLQTKPGFVEASAMRSPDEPGRLIVTSKWTDVGSYRRALSSTESKMTVWPFLADMHDEPSAFEVLLSASELKLEHYKTSLN